MPDWVRPDRLGAYVETRYAGGGVFRHHHLVVYWTFGASGGAIWRWPAN